MKHIQANTLTTELRYYGPSSKIVFSNTQGDVEGASVISKEMRGAIFFVTVDSLRSAGFTIELISSISDSVNVWDVDDEGRIILAWQPRGQGRMTCILTDANEPFAGWILEQWEAIVRDTAPRIERRAQSPQLSASPG